MDITTGKMKTAPKVMLRAMLVAGPFAITRNGKMGSSAVGI
jgi:hypothetical protein